GRIVALGAVAPEDEEVIGRELNCVETERCSAARKRPVEFGARPVGDGHEIVAEGLHARARSVADRLLVIADPGAIVAASRLDLLADADALAHRPDKAAGLDLGPALRDLVLAPDLAPVHVMEGADDADRPGLTHILQTNGIVRPKPAPSLQHASSCHSRRSRSERSGIERASRTRRDLGFPVRPGASREWRSNLPPHRQILLRSRIAKF